MRRSPYWFEYMVRRRREVPCQLMSAIYADAARYLEANPGYDDPLIAIRVAVESRRLDDSVALYAWRHFGDQWSSWFGGLAGDHDERILMMSFSSAMARTGDF